ncbi:MAG TPA: ABC transporter permease subunit [Mycobacteriales bacterium]|jgi:ABC-2 type transport system permease protein|nr:ABC transporter permease subunit [Mycobacteriales bacterium]
MNGFARLRVATSDLRIRRRSLVVWSIAVLLVVLMVIGVYPSIHHNSSIDSIYADLSPTAQALLGGSNLTSPAGYLSTQLFAFFLPAIVLVFAIGRGAAAIAGEEEERTLDLLLAQPVTRTALYLEKGLAVFAGVTLLTAAAWLPISTLHGPLGLDLPGSHLLAICVQLGLFCLALAFVADGVAAATGRRAIGIAVSAGYTFVSYIVYGLAATIHWLRPVRPLTLWRWYLGGDPLGSGFDGWGLVVLAVTCLVALGAGAAAFSRRDVHA